MKRFISNSELILYNFCIKFFQKWQIAKRHKQMFLESPTDVTFM